MDDFYSRNRAVISTEHDSISLLSHEFPTFTTFVGVVELLLDLLEALIVLFFGGLIILFFGGLLCLLPVGQLEPLLHLGFLSLAQAFQLLVRAMAHVERLINALCPLLVAVFLDGQCYGLGCLLDDSRALGLDGLGGEDAAGEGSARLVQLKVVRNMERKRLDVVDQGESKEDLIHLHVNRRNSLLGSDRHCELVTVIPC